MANIEALVAELVPVQPVEPRRGLAAVLIAVAAAIGGVAATAGLRSDILAGTPHPIVIIRGGTLLLLGLAALTAVITSARPGVGRASHGWRWALAAAALFPLTSLAMSALNGGFPEEDLHSVLGPWCLKISCGSGLAIGAVLTHWLRQGAPTSLSRAGWLVGLAAGSFGAFAYSLHCPSTSVYYVGLWYSAAVAVCAGAGRAIVPTLIRW
jgi:hypothetical protein